MLDNLVTWRGSQPGLFAPTEPPRGSQLVADFEPMQTLHVALPDWRDHAEVYVPLLTHASKHGRVRASVVGRVDVRFLTVELAKAGADLARIEFVPEEVMESVWMRDYGPVPVRTDDGPGVLDFAEDEACCGVLRQTLTCCPRRW